MEPSSEVMHVVSAMRDLYDALADFDRHVASTLGVSRNGLTCLLMLEWEPARIGHVAAGCGLTSGAMTSLCDRLVDKGLVSRGFDEQDRRVRTLQLTPYGRGQIGTLYRGAFEAYVAALETFEDLDAARRTLETLARTTRGIAR